MTSDNARQCGPQTTAPTSDNATPSRVGVVARDYQYLSECTAHCESLTAAVANDRARGILTLLAERGRGVLAVIDAEPGLHTHLERLAYHRAVALLAELIRQAHGLIRTVVRQEADGSDHPQRGTTQIWQEAEALAGRTDELGTAAVQHPPRLRLDTTAGSRTLSRRLVDLHQLDHAADTIDAALAAAHRLPRPDPVVDTLAELAAGLREQTTALRADADGEDWWTGYFDRLRREADAAAERERAEARRIRLATTSARS